jgi:hypothetical protein
MRFLMVALTALSLSAGGFMLTPTNHSDAASPAFELMCRARTRIFFCDIHASG